MIYFSSDHHFDHANVIKYCGRPYAGVDEMNRDLIVRWNQQVGDEDTVIYLGDFSLGERPIVEILPVLNGKKLLIAGNHDRVHPAWHRNKAQKAANKKAIYAANGFDEVLLNDICYIGETAVNLCHFPYTGDHTSAGERYPQYRPKDDGKWLLHGHVHQLWKKRGKMINVGVDVWDFFPVSIERIEAEMKK